MVVGKSRFEAPIKQMLTLDKMEKTDTAHSHRRLSSPTLQGHGIVARM